MKNGRGGQGFSLFELLIVLVLMGLIAGIAAPATGRFLDKLRFREQTSQLLAGVRYARLLAISKGRVVRLSLDEQENAIAITGALTEMRPLDLADQGAIELTPASIVFYPEGQASPARLASIQGERRREFVMDPLSGLPVAQ